MKLYENWTRKEFKVLPRIDISKFDYYNTKVDAFVIIPTKKRHDSGFRIMDIVPVVNNDPLGRFADMTDSIQLGDLVENGHWGMDCLPVSGLIRFLG